MSDTPLIEMALRWESDEHYKILTHPSQVLVWQADATGRMDFVSPSWARFTGRALVDELGSGWLERVEPQDAPRLLRTFAAAAASGQPFRIKFRLLRHDGFPCWLAMDGLPVAAPPTHAAAFMGFCLDITPLEQGQIDMHFADQRMIDLLRHTNLAAAALDVEGRVLFLNAALAGLLGKTEAEMIERKLFAECACADCGDVGARLYPQGRQAADFPVEFDCCWTAGAGRHVHMLWHAVVLRDFAGQVKGSILIGEDVTERRAAEEKLRFTQRVFESTDQAMVITDAAADIIAVNQAFTRLTGYAADEVIGRNPRLLQSGRHGREFYQHMWDSLLSTGRWHGDIWDRCKDGSCYPKFLSISAIRDEQGATTHYCGFFYDISERKTIEEKLDRLAHFDSLTGLPNRALLQERLDQAVSQALRSGVKVALLYLDLDHFKQVNDSEGHQAGDELLVQVAQRLARCVRSHDTVARIGGDEFVILLPDVHEMESVGRVAEKIIEVFALPFLVVDREHAVTPSIGISIYPDDHYALDVLLHNADRAMYQAKRDGRNNFMFYHQLSPAEGQSAEEAQS